MIGIKARYNTVVAPQRAQALRRIPQRTPSLCELLSYLLLAPLMIMAGAMPTASLFLLPVILCFLYLLYRRFGVYLPFACIIGYGVAALTINYDILTVVFALGLFFGFCGLLVALQISPYLMSAFVAAAFSVLGALGAVGIIRLDAGDTVGNVAVKYIEEMRDDPVVKYFVCDYYDNSNKVDNKLKPKDEGYYDAALETFSEWAYDEFEYYIWYYCIHFGAVFSAVGYFFAVVINRRTASCYDADADEKTVGLSSRSLGGVRITGPIADMSMPRALLWAVILPAVATGIGLEIAGGYDALTSTLIHTFATLPGAFACFTFLTYLATLFSGRARIAAYVVLVLVGICGVLFPVVLFAMSVLGISDCIINIRFWIRYIKED